MEGRGQTAAHLPAAVLLIFALFCGTFAGGATAGGAVTAHLILWLGVLVFGIWIAAPGRRRTAMQGFGQSGAFLRIAWALPAAWAGVALPWWASPVPRAGSSAVVLVPIFLILPWLVARCWRLGDAARAQRGAFGVGLVVVAVSLRGLWGWLRLGTDGASLPLGHHNLLAAFLVTTLPVAALGLRTRGVYRWVASASVVLGVAAILATRSLAGALALAAVVVVWGLSARSRARRSLGWALLVAVGTVVGLGLVFGGRILAVLEGLDPSTAARIGYWRAGLRGIVERPWLGWGPGSTPWTVHEFFRPVPGVHPPDQVLADLHNLPLQLLYELGVVGCGLVALALVGAWWSLRRRPVADRGLVTAGVAGLVGFAVASLGGLPLSVLAVPVAACLAAGAVLAGFGLLEIPPHPPSRQAGHSDLERSIGSLKAAALVAVLLAAGFVLQAHDRAHLAYDRAVHADSDADRVAHLRRAVELDPRFPLYRWRLAMATDDAAMARVASRQAPAVAALHLTAEEWHAACRLSRLGAVAPFGASLLTSDPDVFARAILAQPWWMAAVEWRGREEAIDRAVASLIVDPRVEIGWRAGLRDAWAQARTGEGEVTSVRRLVLDVDDVPATSLSLHTFRRSPWPARVAEIRLDVARLVPLAEIPPATQLPTTDPSLFSSADCSVGD